MVHRTSPGHIIGAGFLGRTLATGLVLFAATRWRSLETLPPPCRCSPRRCYASTLIHNDRFEWDYVPTWLSLIVYASIRSSPCPVVLPAAGRRSRRLRNATCACAPPVRGLRPRLLVGAAALFVAPVEVGAGRPALTPLLRPHIAPWYRDGRDDAGRSTHRLPRLDRGRDPLGTLAASCLLLLALLLLASTTSTGRHALHRPGDVVMFAAARAGALRAGTVAAATARTRSQNGRVAQAVDAGREVVLAAAHRHHARGAGGEQRRPGMQSSTGRRCPSGR